MSAVSLVQDDRLWPDNPQYLLVGQEVESYLDEQAVISEHAGDATVARDRGIRRRTTAIRRRHHGSKCYGTEGAYKGDHPRLKAMRMVLDADVVDETGCAPRRPSRLALIVPTEVKDETDDEPVDPEPVTRTRRPRRRRRKKGKVVVVYAQVSQKRRVYDPTLDDRRAAIRDQLQKLEVQLLFRLTKRKRQPLEEQIAGLRGQLQALEATA